MTKAKGVKCPHDGDRSMTTVCLYSMEGSVSERSVVVASLPGTAHHYQAQTVIVRHNHLLSGIAQSIIVRHSPSLSGTARHCQTQPVFIRPSPVHYCQAQPVIVRSSPVYHCQAQPTIVRHSPVHHCQTQPIIVRHSPSLSDTSYHYQAQPSP